MAAPLEAAVALARDWSRRSREKARRALKIRAAVDVGQTLDLL
jgi:hypothetical protein